MSHTTQIQISGFGVRLKQERERLGLTLSDFAGLAGMTRMTQTRYESGTHLPTVEYLLTSGCNGVDSVFLVTGVTSSNLIPMQNANAFSVAIDVVAEISKRHNVTFPPDFRLRAISQVYQRILKAGGKKVTPSLEDLLSASW